LAAGQALMKRWTVLLALAAGAAFAGDGVKIDKPWARPTVAGQHAGGAFVTLTSARGDKLVGGHTPAAERVELHEMKMEGDVMRMREVGTIELPAGRAVELKPGGLHLMFMGLKAPLKAGDTLPLVLRFEKAGEVKLDVKVSVKAP
jgi:copper(I)-binding protein